MDQRFRGLEMRTSLSALASLALPGWCTVCGRRLNYRERFLCLECMADLPLTRFETLGHNPMADRYNSAFAAQIQEYEPYQWAVALLYYNAYTGYANIPRNLKYYRSTAEGRYFARMLSHNIALATHFRDIDLIVPVPLHWLRKLRRGYNQAAVIGSELSRCLGVPMDERLLVRVRRTTTQTALDREAKARNVQGAFSLNGRSAASHAVHHILLVDDVMTSGATLAQCHSALRTYFGPEVRISCATLAFVG